MRTAQKYLAYVDFVGEGDTTRSQAAEHFKVSKSTATYHLERGVTEGMLERFYSWTDEFQTGWAYRKKGQENLIPFEGEVEQDPDLLDQLFEDGTEALDLDTWAQYPPDGEVVHIDQHFEEYYADRVWEERWNGPGS